MNPKQNIARVLATGLGAGYSPVAPGTAGTILALVVFILFPYSTTIYFVILTAILFVVGTWSATVAEKNFGHDGSPIVIDEIVGYMMTVLYVPLSGEFFWVWALMAFALFRFFDILKPPPIFQAQSLPKGWGVMLDDVLAGIYGNIILQVLIRFVFN